MKKFIIYLLKPFSFLPAIAMMYLIFSFSAQTGTESGNLSHEISYHLVSVADRVLDKGLSEEEKNAYADKIEFPVRKLAHMTEYFILAICMSFPLYVYGVRGFWLFLLAGLLCVGFACTDEFHQLFVPGRAGRFTDVLIDTTGGIIMLLFIALVTHVAHAKHTAGAVKQKI